MDLFSEGELQPTRLVQWNIKSQQADTIEVVEITPEMVQVGLKPLQAPTGSPLPPEAQTLLKPYRAMWFASLRCRVATEAGMREVVAILPAGDSGAGSSTSFRRLAAQVNWALSGVPIADELYDE